MLPIEKIISKTLNLKQTEKSKTVEALMKGRDLPKDPKFEKMAAEAEKILKAYKTEK
ncbi:MAG: hypothetical protein PHX78_10555 [bacterium]|nr:hypothetical protein [bacterium]